MTNLKEGYEGDGKYLLLAPSCFVRKMKQHSSEMDQCIQALHAEKTRVTTVARAGVGVRVWATPDTD